MRWLKRDALELTHTDSSIGLVNSAKNITARCSGVSDLRLPKQKVKVKAYTRELK